MGVYGGSEIPPLWGYRKWGAAAMVCLQGESPAILKTMTLHPPVPALYKRVRYLTNIGEHAEAAALFDDLRSKTLKDSDRHGKIHLEA